MPRTIKAVLMESHIPILRCPHTGEDLVLVKDPSQNGFPGLPAMDSCLANTSGTWLYPVMNGIIFLLPHYAVQTGETPDAKVQMPYNRDRVFRYYNEVSYSQKEGKTIYSDSGKWVDYREVSDEYIRNSFRRAKKYLDGKGKYYLDVASGPIGLPEYIDLSRDYEVRICVDISYKALEKARANYPGEGLFICGDIANIPLKEGVCDAVLSQHTLYHVPRREQATAVRELYRVAKPGGRVAIVYSWFYYSLLMDIALLPIQLYRVARYFLSLGFSKFLKDRPRLYFYVHSPLWFKRFEFAKHMRFYCWRSANKYFLNTFIHKGLFGERILRWLMHMEDRYPVFFGWTGDYPVIVIDKPKR